MAAPLYHVTGDDELFVQRAVERLLAELEEQHDDLTVDRYDVQETEHLPEMRTTSLFGGRTCIVLREDAGRQGRLSGDLKRELEDYVEAPDDEAILVLVTFGVGHIRKLAEAIAHAGKRIEAKTPPPFKHDAWTQFAAGEFERGGRKADPRAVRALLDHAGYEPAAIASKVAQVVAGTAPGTRIGVEDVERLVEGHGSHGGFVVADRVADRDPAAAIVELRGVLESGLDPLPILGALTAKIRDLLQVRAGAPIKGSPGKRKFLERQARAFAPGELPWCHDRLARADLELKGDSELPPEIVLELAVLDVATSREVGAPWNPLAR